MNICTPCSAGLHHICTQARAWIAGGWVHIPCECPHHRPLDTVNPL